MLALRADDHDALVLPLHRDSTVPAFEREDRTSFDVPVGVGVRGEKLQVGKNVVGSVGIPMMDVVTFGDRAMMVFPDDSMLVEHLAPTISDDVASPADPPSQTRVPGVNDDRGTHWADDNRTG